ncbi:MAG: heavy metal-binding domain-containing protein [Bacilli bacterium]
MFRFHLGFGSRDGKDKNQEEWSSPPPPKLDIAALKQQEAERSRKSLDALTHGHLPPGVVERIHAQQAGDLPWTSDLSVNEWLALRQYKIRPLGQVMGSSFYQVGYVGPTSYNSMGSYYTASHELQGPTKALYEGRRLAISRLEQEAALMGANAVVGVHLEKKGFSQADGVVEYVCYGTAVQVEGLKQPARPVLSTVSGQDFARLIIAGHLPVGLALGATFYYLRTDWWDAQQERSWYNQEMQHFTQGMYTARHLAQKKLREDLQKMGATGVVGAEFEMHVEEIEGGQVGDGERVQDHIVEVVMLGTAVERVESGVHPDLKVTPVFDLRS